jgi:hypothetical protein
MGVQGLMGVKTAIDNRQVIREVRDIFASNPLDINSTFEWIPVDNWIGLSSVKSCVREIKSQIMSEETWCLSLEFFGSSVDAEPLRKELFDCVPNQVSEERPDKILRVLVIKDQVAVSILKNENSFVIENG